MPVDWKSKESYTRLLAAMVAATPDMKLDYRKIASFYGEGATYDAIEGRFRVIKREAAVLKSEIDDGVRPEAPARNTATVATPKKPRTPKKDGILNGRISKSTNNTPTKRRSVKQELQSFSASASSIGDALTPGIENAHAHVFEDFDPTIMSFEMMNSIHDEDMMGGNGVELCWDEQGV